MTAIPSSEVNAIIKSIFMKMPAKKIHHFGRKNMLQQLLSKAKNQSNNTAHVEMISSFFEKIKTDGKYEADILTYELSDISVGPILCFAHESQTALVYSSYLRLKRSEMN